MKNPERIKVPIAMITTGAKNSRKFIFLASRENLEARYKETADPRINPGSFKRMG